MRCFIGIDLGSNTTKAVVSHPGSIGAGAIGAALWGAYATIS